MRYLQLLLIAGALFLPACAREQEAPLVFKVVHPDFDPHYAYVEDLSGQTRATAKSFEGGALSLAAKDLCAPWRAVLMYPCATFGEVMLAADNGGRGFSGDEGERVLEVELARTKATRLQARARWAEGEGLRADAATARALVDQALRACKAGDPAECADVLDRLCWAAEAFELAIADEAAERNRRAELAVSVTGPDGDPVAGVTVTIEPQRPGLLIGNGAPLPMGSSVEAPILAAFNFITLPFYLPQLKEGRDGLIGLPVRHANARFLTERGVELKGHPLVWFFDAHTPQWLRDMSYDELKTYIHDHVYAVVKEFAGEVDRWDVINEAHSWANSLNLSADQLVEVTGIAAAAAVEANPAATIVVNTCLPWGDYVAWRDDDSLMTPYEYLLRCVGAGVQFDIVGLQMYNAYASPFPCRDLVEMSACLDRYAALGKPIHVTEFVVPTEATEFGTWHGPKWTPELQAEFTDGFYRVCAGKPYVEAITWWSIVDRDKDWAHTGLLYRDESPKPVYDVVRHHTATWTTVPAAVTGPDGTATFRVWAGAFRVRAEGPGGAAEAGISAAPGEPVLCVLSLGAD